MVLDEIKIAIGPYVFGISLAITAFLFEKYFNFKNNHGETKLKARKNIKKN